METNCATLSTELISALLSGALSKYFLQELTPILSNPAKTQMEHILIFIIIIIVIRNLLLEPALMVWASAAQHHQRQRIQDLARLSAYPHI